MAQTIPLPLIGEVPAKESYGPTMAVLSLVFFMWGFVTVLSDILVPHLKAIFDLSYAGTVLVHFIFFGAYFLVSLPASKVISRIGYSRTIVLGLAVMACCALLFLPALDPGCRNHAVAGCGASLRSGPWIARKSFQPPEFGASAELARYHRRTLGGRNSDSLQSAAGVRGSPDALHASRLA